MPATNPPSVPETAARQRWLAALARASADELGSAWDTVASPPTFRWLKPAESGLVMVRGRIGGTGAKFNIGEAAVTRCVVQTEQGFVGVGYVLGRDRRQAELTALFDALLQDPARRAAVEAKVVAPLAASQRERWDEKSRKSAATKVEFYTLVRGDGD